MRAIKEARDNGSNFRFFFFFFFWKRVGVSSLYISSMHQQVRQFSSPSREHKQREISQTLSSEYNAFSTYQVAHHRNWKLEAVIQG